MKLNTTSQYAIRIMTFIVNNDSNKLFNAKIISEKLSIPYKYLTKIMTQLVDANIIVSIRGREGGYSIAKEASQIKILDILNAVKECLHSKNCLLGLGTCNETKKCAMHDRWREPKISVLDMFINTTLADIAKV